MDPNGFMMAQAKLTRTGVFPYLKYDGTISNELRHPDDVFDSKSLESAKSLVMCNDHPDGMIYTDNAKACCIGFTGEKVDIVDGKYLQGSIKIIDQKAISDVMQGGKSQISMGYRCDVIEEIGNYQGQPYNARQKNITYNHGALVWEGRAGPEVGLKMDSADKDFAVMKLDDKNKSCKTDQAKVQSDNKSNEKIISRDKKFMKIKIDAIDFEVEDSAAQAIQIKMDADKKEIEAAKSDVSKAQAKADAFQSELAKRDSEIEALKKDLTDEVILSRADSLLKVKAFAKEILGEDKKDSIEDIKKAVVLKQTGVDCSKKDSAYIDAAFEVLMATHKSAEKKDALQEAVNKADGKQEVEATDWQKARADSMKKLIAESNKK